MRSSSAASSNRRAVCEFPGVQAGVYAISVFHDAKGHFGPPQFDAAKFTFSGGRLEMKITIQYL